MRSSLWLASLGIALLSLLSPDSAEAAGPEGIYAIIDPYSGTVVNQSGDIYRLYQASQATCPQAGSVTSPFCGTTTNGAQPVNGIYLAIQWCSYELYYVESGNVPAACHYLVRTPPNKTAKASVANPDTESPCNNSTGYQYDICPNSILYQALSYIVQINKNRTAAGLTQLKLSIGLISGFATPLSYVLPGSGNYVGYEDLPEQIPNESGKLTQDCVRLPQVWTKTYIKSYEAALDSLVTQINDYSDSAGNLSGTVRIVKVTPINTLTNELDSDGRYDYIAAPTDDSGGSFMQGGTIQCPKQTDQYPDGADHWLNDYKYLYTSGGGSSSSHPDCDIYAGFESGNPPQGSGSLAQGNECVLGGAIGHMRETVKNISTSNPALLSIPSNGSTIMPDINCGAPTGAEQACTDMIAGDEWARYYFFLAINDLFNTGSVAQVAANDAYKANGGKGTFAIPSNQLSTNWTALQSDSYNPLDNFFSDPQNVPPQGHPLVGYNANYQVSCALNNTSQSHGVQFIQNGQEYPASSVLVGSGTVIGWQTQCPSHNLLNRLSHL